tara:strand:+ start:69 stop:266 length:198 start_codon:yes stop_codon:yes gene_type:complete
MKVISVRVNKTIEYEVFVPVTDERSLDENLEYLSSIQWDKRMGFFASKEIAEYFDWLDYNIFETK